MTFERNNTANDFETMLRRHLARSNRLNAPCAEFDAELANAYLEGLLEESPRLRYEIHLAGCADCRHAMVALYRLAPADAHVLPASPTRQPLVEWWQSFKDGLRMPGWRYAAVGMASAFVAFGAFYVWQRPLSELAPRSQVAMAPSTSGAVSSQDQAQAQASRAVVGTTVPSSSTAGGIRPEPRKDQPGQLARARLNTSSGMLAGPSQTASSIISGKVSSIGGLAVPEAEVALVDTVSQQTQAATRTDALGQFKLPALPEGNYRLTVQAEGYAPQQISDVRPVIAQELQVKLDLGPSGRQAIASLQQRSVATETEEKKESSSDIIARREAQRRQETAVVVSPAPPPGLADNSRPVPDATRRLAPREAAPKPKPRATPTRSSEDENFRALVRKVREKTFRFDRGVWIDQEYKPENRLPRTRLTHESPEFEKVISDIPSLAPFFDLGKVIVVWQGRVYEVRK